MADYLVTGIAPTSDPKQLEKTLLETGCKFDAEQLAIVTKVQQTAAHEQSQLRFVHATEGSGGRGSVSSSMTATVMSGSGTGVPGIGGSNASLSSFVGGSHVQNYLGDLPVPVDVRENYNIAIEEGRSVVTYKAAESETEEVQQAFRNCGLRNVKVFKPKVSSSTPMSS
jgi:hypothetical protein